MAKAVKVHSFSDDRPCNFSDNLSGITCLVFTARIIKFEIYLVQDTGTEFCHEQTQYNDANTQPRTQGLISAPARPRSRCEKALAWAGHVSLNKNFIVGGVLLTSLLSLLKQQLWRLPSETPC